MMKRSISFVLCVIMLFSAILPVAHVFGRSEGVYITAEGRDVEEISINFDEKTVVSAESFGFEAEGYQWQILIDAESGLWVNIFDKTEPECEVSYALVKTVFDASGEAFIRCKALYNGEWQESEAVKVSVSFEEKVKETVYEEPVLVTDMIIVESDEEIPEEIPEVIPETIIEGESILTQNPETEEPVEEEPVEEEPVEEEIVEEEPIEEEPVEEEIVEEEPIEEEPIEEEPIEEEPIEEESVEEEIIEEEIIEEEPVEEEIIEEEPVEEKIIEEEIIEGEIILSEDYAEEEPQTFAFFSRSLNSAEGQALDGDGNEITEEFITITINYLDYSTKGTADEREIYSSYVASIQKGSHFAQKIISPTYTGFAPFYDPMGGDDITTNATIMDLNLREEETQNNIIYNVYYKAIEVPYGVRYFFQNINDDLYSERQEYYHVHYALTGTFIENKNFDACTEVTKDTSGFELMYHIPDTVAADGSTVFELYYDRNYYLIQFDFDGGYGDDPIYARYGTPFVINKPIKAGYTFLGWDIDGDGSVDEVPTTIQDENQTYTAIWKNENTSYTVAYWLQKSDDTFEFIGSRVEGAISGSKVNGSDDLFVESGMNSEVHSCGLQEHSHGSGCNMMLNCTFDEHEHIESCYNCGKTGETHEHSASCCSLEHKHVPGCWGEYTDKRDPTSKPEETPKDGYVFFSWPRYYIYLKGSWYHYLGPATDEGKTIEPKCGKTEHDHTSGCDYKNCASGGHVHDESCLSCGKTGHVHDDSCYVCATEAHTHDNSCKIKDLTTEYKENLVYYNDGLTSKNVTVNGDGSTVVNVYYGYKEFNLRFYYAMEKKGNYYVVGGSTYKFGSDAGVSNKGDEIELLKQYSEGNYQIGQVKNLPDLNERGKALVTNGKYKLNSITVNDWTYYYVEFTARYDEDISELWPCDVFGSAERSGSNSHGLWSGTEAFVSAWNGEHNVRYSHDTTINNSNQTIKGKYSRLDTNILWYKAWYGSYADTSDTVSYLCFWENGANINWSVPELYQYNIWVNTYEGQNPEAEGIPTKEYNGVTYYLYDSYATVDDSKPEQQTFPSIEGFDKVGDKGVPETITDFDTTLYKEAYKMHFYYKAIENELTFYNYNATIDDMCATVDTAEKLQKYFDFVPEYPLNLEPNAYYFDGWYLDPNCQVKYKGEVLRNDKGEAIGYDVGEEKMPGYNLTLYAKWAPTTHKVNFFESYDDMLKFENDPTSIIPYATKIVDHRENVGSVTSPEGVGESVFGGWFYIENGQKKAYTPTDFPVKRDMNVFADWGGGDTYAPFRISYFTIDENGVKHKVADDYTGFAKVGTTKTFNAKGGAPLNQLYPLYNDDAYFPVLASHSEVIRYDEAKRPEDATKNVYEFEYVKAKIPISYRIMYYDSETNQPIIDPETGTAVQTELKSTTNAVVTERFKAIEGYIPDAFYKRLVISVKKAGDTFVGNDEENVIIFYYSKNQESAYYAVHFMLEKLDSSGNHDYKIDGTGDYEENGTHIEGIGDIDSTIPINVSDFKFSGFDLVEDAAIVVVGGEQQSQKPTYSDEKYEITVEKNGTELYIFYDRNDYPYEVYYYLYNSTDGVPYEGGIYPHKTVTSEGNEDRIGTYGSTVTEEAPEIPGYTCESQSEQTMIIREEEKENGNWVVTHNKMIFYYSPTQYTVEYIAVPETGGELSKTIEVITGNDDFVGSVPKAYPDYEFAGWFTDEECTVPVVVSGDDRIADYNEETKGIKPVKGKMDDKNSNKFYAKFVPKTGKLTITRENACDDNQVYVYEVRNENGSFVMTVTVVGNASVTINNLPFGKYTVTQLNYWSWRNDDVSQTVNHESVEGSTVVFGYAPGYVEADKKWLNGNSALVPNVAKNIIEQEED